MCICYPCGVFNERTNERKKERKKGRKKERKKERKKRKKERKKERKNQRKKETKKERNKERKKQVSGIKLPYTLVNYATPCFILLLYFLCYFIVWYINK